MKHQLEDLSNKEFQILAAQKSSTINGNGGGQLATAGVTSIFGKLQEPDKEPII